MKPLEFQQKAIEELTAKFKTLWNANQQSQLILKSPTGSGKTFMTTSFIEKALKIKEKRLLNINKLNCCLYNINKHSYPNGSCVCYIKIYSYNTFSKQF